MLVSYCGSDGVGFWLVVTESAAATCGEKCARMSMICAHITYYYYLSEKAPDLASLPS
jgi:hypothetical protein